VQIVHPSILYYTMRHVSHVAKILDTFSILHEAPTFHERKVESPRNPDNFTIYDIQPQKCSNISFYPK